MFIEKYCHNSKEQISFSRQQASDFAKKIADDFNPLHDVDAKRFCVPGDLLFSLVLAKSGLHQQMTFKFSGMVSNDVLLNFPENITEQACITDDNGKEYMQVTVAGDKTKNESLITSLIRSYVEFSGHTFPHILVKLMAEKNVMINPSRPMVMYESMSIDLNTLDVPSVNLAFSGSTLSLDGKRGNACLEFDLTANEKIIGHGKKYMLLSGLREYCPEVMDSIVNEYNTKKARYLQAQ
ncbi:DUF3581 family protein [Colwelliaceae bacterium 6471]